MVKPQIFFYDHGQRFDPAVVCVISLN